MSSTDLNGYSRTPGDLPPGMSGATPMPPIGGGTTEPEGETAVSESQALDAWLIQQARTMYVNSTDYLDANVTLAWERNLYHFRSEHSPDTAYARKDWKRSRTFRPKTRANVKAQEASHAAAAFSTQEFVDVQPQDPTDQVQQLSAEIVKALLQHRLETSVPWFLTAQGAYQDTKVYGICISHQYWQYREDVEVVPAFDAAGQPILGEDEVPVGSEKRVVVEDRPCVDLVEPENFRFDPMCDWRDPATSSPYLIYLMPMYAGDVLERMDQTDRKTGQPLWRRYPLEQVIATRTDNADNRTRRAREGDRRVDPTNTSFAREFMTVWAHLNIKREKGTDIAWWTLGTDLVLSDPVPLVEMYPHLRRGERPFVVGFSTIEAHRNYPAGDVEQAAPLQTEINAIANQRLDNVKLVLNKRYFVRRGSQIDLEALMRNVPGGGVMVNDPDKDVNVVNTPDVTGSSYQEQDRLNVEFDELVGGFSAGSVQSNRKLNETVGGLDRLAESAGAVQDYGVKIFFETWMEPVLRQLVRLEQMYETDEVLLALAAKQSSAWQKYGKSTVDDFLLQQSLTTRVNVGIGNTDPMKRVQKLIFGISQVVTLPGMGERLKSDAVANEIFGSLGYKDSTRFFLTEEQMAQKAQQSPPQPPPEVALKMRELDIREADTKLRDARERERLKQDREIAMSDLAVKSDVTIKDLETKLGIASQRNRTMRDVAAVREANRMAEINQRAAQPKPAPTAKKEGPPRE